MPTSSAAPAAPLPGPRTLAAPVAPIQPAPLDQADGHYHAGVCNIGAWEIRRRRRSALIGFVISAVFLAALVVAGVPAIARLLVVFPLWGSMVSWLQARRQFCVGFAVARLSNFADEENGRERVDDEAAHRADMRTVRRMTIDGFLIAAPITLVVVGLLQVVRPAWHRRSHPGRETTGHPQRRSGLEEQGDRGRG